MEEEEKIEGRQGNIKRAILKGGQKIAANFGGLGRFPDGNPFSLARFFEAFSDILHCSTGSLARLLGKGNAKV